MVGGNNKETEVQDDTDLDAKRNAVIRPGLLIKMNYTEFQFGVASGQSSYLFCSIIYIIP